MPQENQSEITFDGLREFLCRIGFDEPARIGGSLAFHHHKSDTIIVLSIPQDGRSVGPADLLSVMMRLENQGLVEHRILDQFRSGKLPLAS